MRVCYFEPTTKVVKLNKATDYSQYYLFLKVFMKSLR